jgi:hypothetical protein
MGKLNQNRMKATDFYTEEQLVSAESYWGMSFYDCTEKRKAILTTIYHFKEGWIDEDGLEKTLTKIIKSK